MITNFTKNTDAKNYVDSNSLFFLINKQTTIWVNTIYTAVCFLYTIEFLRAEPGRKFIYAFSHKKTWPAQSGKMSVDTATTFPVSPKQTTAIRTENIRIQVSEQGSIIKSGWCADNKAVCESIGWKIATRGRKKSAAAAARVSQGIVCHYPREISRSELLLMVD